MDVHCVSFCPLMGSGREPELHPEWRGEILYIRFHRAKKLSAR
ncbi:hypothetical protein BRPE64_BCDS02490 [Caballeronia insecticola]|uniref:Uncharacterized protein n=1 Tax=Caballeronia insecticola TaxID=758793 RepID=R4WV68_9BURK|nr:hypothetical protein BRPE64_BCDS02490 [Caballeronia insecticola]